MNSFKAWGVLPLLLELEKAACPHKYTKNHFCQLVLSDRETSQVSSRSSVIAHGSTRPCLSLGDRAAVKTCHRPPGGTEP
ncbi:MAG: hypothetical protein ACKON9_16375, partial [Planctomycetaceae bacterium]